MTDWMDTIDMMGDMDDPDYFVPHHLRDGLLRYFHHRVETGGFLRSLLENDLEATLRKADSPETRLAVLTTLNWIQRHAPAASYGSARAVRQWLDRTG